MCIRGHAVQAVALFQWRRWLQYWMECADENLKMSKLRPIVLFDTAADVRRQIYLFHGE